MKAVPGFCDRCEQRFKLSDLIEEDVLGKYTGKRVCRFCYDASHPQLDTRNVKTNDKQSVDDPRPDPSLDESRALYGWRPVGHQSTGVVFVSVGRVRVTT